MRSKKYSKFKMYIITTLLAFIISATIGIFIASRYKNDYLKMIVSYVNEKSPIDIYIKDINIDYPLRILVDDIRVFSKQESNPFLTVNNASLGFNLFRVFSGKGAFYIINSIEVTDTTFYPLYVDEKLFQTTNTNQNNDDIKKRIEETLTFFIDKNMTVKNFSLELSKEESKSTKINLSSLYASLWSKGYTLQLDLNLPDNTDLTFSILTSTNLTEIDSVFYAKDKTGTLLEYDLNAFSTNGFFNVSFFDAKQNNDIGTIKYDYLEKRADFVITNFNIKKALLTKLFSIAGDMPIVSAALKNNEKTTKNISTFINSFNGASFYANGYYKTGEPLYVKMNASANDKTFALFFDATLTNNNFICSNATLRNDTSVITASGVVPIQTPVLSDFRLEVKDLLIGVKPLNMLLTIKPKARYVSSYQSIFSIEELQYTETITSPLKWNITYREIENSFSINLITNENSETFNFRINMNTNSRVIAEGFGEIPKELFSAFLGYNIIDPLSTISFNYSYSNEKYTKGLGAVHRILVSSKKIYTEENMITADVLLYTNIIDIKNIYYNTGSSGVEVSGKVHYDKDGNFDVDGELDTQFTGVQKFKGYMKQGTNEKVLFVSTDNSLIVANGIMKDNGERYFSIKTPTNVAFNNIKLGGNIVVDNTEKENRELSIYGEVFAKSEKTPVFSAAANFELSNKSVLFTNIAYTYRGNSISGSGELVTEGDLINFSAILKEENTEGVIATEFSVNKSNILGTVAISSLPFSVLMGGEEIYGQLNTKATIVGLLSSPVVYLESFSVKDLQVPGYRFNISMSGFYKKGEVELKNVEITKTGENGFVITKEDKVVIESAYFSKDIQSAKIDFRNFFMLSLFNGKIEYNMRRLPSGEKEYRVTSSPIIINERTLPAFSTIAVDYGTNIIFRNTKNHGITGVLYIKDKELKPNLKYIFSGEELLNITGSVKNTKTNQVDLLLTSNTLSPEIFEIFSVLFTSIKSAKTSFTVDNKPYTLNARVHGDINDLAITGRFLGKASKVKIAYFAEEFNDTTVDFIFEGHTARVGELKFVTSKKKNLTITGDAEINNNFVNYINFDLLTSDEQVGLLNANANIKVLKARGPVHLDMHIGGDLKIPRMSGVITLSRSDIQLTIDPANRYEERVYGVSSKMYWDLLIQAWRRVRFAHNLVGDAYIEDGAEMRVYNSIADGMELQGTINLERGNIYYLQNIYQIERASIIFPEINSLDPIIDATAYTYTKYFPPYGGQVIDTAGYNVTLYMEMNARVSSLLFNLASSGGPIKFYTIPALGQYQVNQLAGLPTGNFGQESQIYAETTTSANSTSLSIKEQQLQQLTMSYSDLLLRNTVLRPVERWVRQFLGIDYINLSPTVVNNLLFYNDGNNNNSLSAASIWNNTSVSIGKYVSKDLYIKYDVTYRFNDPTRPSYFNYSPQDPYFFDHQFGFEVSLLRSLRLANFVFEYKINPFEVQRVRQEFNVVTRWRF